tara:strand:- start:358 stop:1707 length:1350 start_codon:yes stop_codon:yes gene_type:complete
MKSKSEADQTGVGEVAGSIEDPVPPGEVDQVDGADEVEEVEETLVDGNHALVAENLTGDGPSPTTSLSLTVEAELLPSAARPARLGGRSFAQDVWGRVQSSPQGYRLGDASQLDYKTHLLASQLLLAAQERESEIVEHNQARVFAQVLRGALEAMRGFMAKPIPVLPASWTQPPPLASAESREVDDTAVPVNQQPEVSLLKKVLIAFVTPQYILVAAVAVFAVAAGYSQLKIKNLESAITSYREAAGAADTLKERLEGLNKTFDEDRSALDLKISELTIRMAKVESERDQVEQALNSKQAELLSSQTEVKTLEERIATRQEAESDRVKALQTSQEELQAQLLASQKDLSEVKVREASLKAQGENLEKTQAEYEKLIKKRNGQLDVFRRTNRQLAVEVERLRSIKFELQFANTFVRHMRREVGTWNDPDEDDIIQFLREYDSAVKAIRQR